MGDPRLKTAAVASLQGWRCFPALCRRAGSRGVAIGGGFVELVVRDLVEHASCRASRSTRWTRWTISFRLLYGLLILHHDRRQILWLGVTTHPTAEWISRQLTEAYGWKVEPRYIIRDRDGVYGDVFIRRLRAMSIRDRPTAARSPWQNGYCERAIGSIRRECLDHVVVFGERHLRHLLRSYATYYNPVS
jgi:hypothetical protein